MASRRPGSASDPLWFRDAIIYELHVKAFSDSNADGVGDFEGLLQKLDYLQDLGVTCIWLLPFFPSPMRDDGYDISDYMNVHPSYGTLADFETFLNAAHERDLQVVIELAKREDILRAIRNTPDVLMDPLPALVVKAISGSTVDLTIHAWVARADDERPVIARILEASKAVLSGEPHPQPVAPA